MTRPNLLVGALAASCVGMLLWCARLTLTADLPLGAHIAAWALWLVAATAVVTLLAYLREFLMHRQAVGRDASWKPLPSLVLLWVGGLTALLSFGFILPDKSSTNGAEGPTKAGTSLTAQTVAPAPATTTTAASTPRPAAESTSSSRSVASRTAPPAAPSTAPQSTSTTDTTAADRTAPRSSTATPSTTSSPLIDIHILPTPARPTTPPGR